MSDVTDEFRVPAQKWTKPQILEAVVWWAIGELIGALHSMPFRTESRPISIRRRAAHGKYLDSIRGHPEWADVKIGVDPSEVPAWFWQKYRERLERPGKRVPLARFPKDLRDARKILDVLVTKGHLAACREYNRVFSSARVGTPRPFVGMPPLFVGQRTLDKKPVHGLGTTPGNTYFPPAITLWFLLFERAAYKRLRRCILCGRYLLDPTKGHVQKRCKACTSVVTSRDHRKGGRKIREAEQVTG